MMTGGGEPSRMTTLPCKMTAYVSAAADPVKPRNGAARQTPKNNRFENMAPPE
jgi:hypothetical protein